jgi:hypothetical protein
MSGIAMSEITKVELAVLGLPQRLLRAGGRRHLCPFGLEQFAQRVERLGVVFHQQDTLAEQRRR